MWGETSFTKTDCKLEIVNALAAQGMIPWCEGQQSYTRFSAARVAQRYYLRNVIPWLSHLVVGAPIGDLVVGLELDRGALWKRS